jgi:hypothetical protein
MKPWQLRSVERAQHDRLARWPSTNRAMPDKKAGVRCAAGRWITLSLALLASSTACLPHEEQRLTCDDVYPPGEFDYLDIESLIVQNQTRTTKGCLGAPCHSAGTQRGGIRLDTRNLIYEELSTRPELYYETLATGYMPHDGIPWDEEDLKTFRSWYCAGAFPP